jgi:hypothetical protein
MITLSACSAYAQISDVFQAAFKTIAGFNIGANAPLDYFSDVNNDNNPKIPKNGQAWGDGLAYSIKFTPLRFGSLIHDEKSDQKVEVDISFDTTKTPWIEKYDTIKRNSKDSIIGSNHYQTFVIVSKGTSVTLDTLRYNQTAWVPGSSITLNLGYSVISNFNFVSSSGLTASFPINALTFEAVVTPHGWQDVGCGWGFHYGVGISTPSLTNVKALSGDTIVLISSSTAFALEGFVGINLEFTTGLGLVLDAGVKNLEFRGVSYVAGTTGKPPNPQFYGNSPSVIDASNVWLRLGLSVDFSS